MRHELFIAILTPSYLNRPNCGKELGVFLSRSPGLNINVNGELTGVTNVLPIRWMPEDAYSVNGEKDAGIPVILRRVEDAPADDLVDPERTKAIEKYRRNGMRGCVSRGTRLYQQLLDLIAKRIRDSAELPPAVNVNFATATTLCDDWFGHFNAVKPKAATNPPPVAGKPAALHSLVVFYLTKRNYGVASISSTFSDNLLAEPTPDTTSLIDPQLATLLGNIRSAATDEGLEVFHAASSLAKLLSQLIALTKSHVPVTVAIDADLWSNQSDVETANIIEQIVGSLEWRGPVLQVSFDGNAAQADRVFPSRVISLPEPPDERRRILRNVFVETRGDVLRNADRLQDSERLPLLTGVGGDRP